MIYLTIIFWCLVGFLCTYVAESIGRFYFHKKFALVNPKIEKMNKFIIVIGTLMGYYSIGFLFGCLLVCGHGLTLNDFYKSLKAKTGNVLYKSTFDGKEFTTVEVDERT